MTNAPVNNLRYKSRRHNLTNKSTAVYAAKPPEYEPFPLKPVASHGVAMVQTLFSVKAAKIFAADWMNVKERWIIETGQLQKELEINMGAACSVGYRQKWLTVKATVAANPKKTISTATVV